MRLSRSLLKQRVNASMVIRFACRCSHGAAGARPHSHRRTQNRPSAFPATRCHSVGRLCWFSAWWLLPLAQTGYRPRPQPTTATTAVRSPRHSHRWGSGPAPPAMPTPAICLATREKKHYFHYSQTSLSGASFRDDYLVHARSRVV